MLSVLSVLAVSHHLQLATMQPCHCCVNRWLPAGSARPVPVLLACNISSTVPGDYKLVFTVINSAGLGAVATRTLTVKPNCGFGERICDDKVSDHISFND